MSVYENVSSTATSNVITGGPLTQKEIHIYGSSRLAVYNVDVNVQAIGQSRIYITMPGVTNNQAELFTFARGNKFFELSNHLGNVLVTVSDKRLVVNIYCDPTIDPTCLPLPDGSYGIVASYYKADVITANDYYPFGMQMPGRKFSTASSSYRYGFNGKENDNEVKGDGNQQDYGMRIYDPRLGRFQSVDPLIIKYPFYSSYQFSGNDVIRCIDLDGGEPLSRIGDWYRNTTTLSGTVYNNVYDKVAHRNFDLQGIVDPWTGKLWIVADDGQGQQQYFYLVNDDGATDRIRTYVENGRTVLYKAHLEKFETRNEIDRKQGAAIADGFGMAIFAAAASITGAYAVGGAVTALTPQAALLYGTYATPAANVVNNYVAPLLDESGQAGNAGAGAVASSVEKTLLNSSITVEKTVSHHIFNAFRGSSPGSQKYRDFFKNLKINVDDHTVKIPESLHKFLHRAGNNWTTQWKSWIDANPKATAKDVYQHAGKMMDEASISNVPIEPHR